MLSVQEFERDMVVHRLTHGLVTKKATSRRINQVGEIKVNGAHSILEKLFPSTSKLRALMQLSERWSNGEFGWRVLSQRFSECLGLKTVMSIETGRRMAQEVALKFEAHSPSDKSPIV